VRRVVLILALGISAASPIIRACSCVTVNASVPFVLANGQESSLLASDDTQDLDAATTKLKVTLSLNQAEYLPDQPIRVKVSITNPTSQRLQIWEPFGKNLFYLSIAPPCMCGRLESSTRSIGPGEAVERTFEPFQDGQFLQLFRASETGEFKLVYSFRRDATVTIRLLARK
jgi:hypothetical protein